MALDCNTMPDVVLEEQCRPISESIGIFFAMKQPTLKEPIDGVEVVGDVTNIDTYQDLLESGDLRYYKIIATDKTSPANRVGTVGNHSFSMGLDEASYIFHIETSDEYLKAIKQMKRFKGKYAATVGQDFIIAAKDDNTSSDLRFLRVADVTPLGADPMNNGTDVPVYLVEVKFKGDETFNKISRGLDFDADVLEQKKIVADGDFTIVASEAALTIVVTDTTGDIITSDYSGTTGDGYIGYIFDGSEITGINYAVVGSVITVDDNDVAEGDNRSVSISNDAPFYNPEYYGVELETTVVA